MIIIVKDENWRWVLELGLGLAVGGGGCMDGGLCEDG